MFRVSLLPGEMTRDISGLRPDSITLKYGSYIEVSEAELKALQSDPILALKLSVMELVEKTVHATPAVEAPVIKETIVPVQVSLEQPKVVKAPKAKKKV